MVAKEEPHVMVFLILKVTMSCTQKAEPPKRRSLHKAEPPCYGVFNIKGHDELHTEGGTPKKAEPPKRRSLHKAEHQCSGVFNIKGHDELHTKGGTPKKAEPPQGGAPMLWCF